MTAKPLPRLAAALTAAQRGWPVFPLHPYSKYPAVRDWERRATCDPDQITHWFMAAPYNIGSPADPHAWSSSTWMPPAASRRRTGPSTA